MRIAQVAPLFERVPPLTYGGTERVVAYLADALVELGHDVTLFASGDSCTRARLVPASERSLPDLVSLAQDTLAFLPDRDREWIFSLTAQTLYPSLAGHSRSR